MGKPDFKIGFNRLVVSPHLTAFGDRNVTQFLVTATWYHGRAGSANRSGTRCLHLNNRIGRTARVAERDGKQLTELSEGIFKSIPGVTRFKTGDGTGRGSADGEPTE